MNKTLSRMITSAPINIALNKLRIDATVNFFNTLRNKYNYWIYKIFIALIIALYNLSNEFHICFNMFCFEVNGFILN